MLTLKTKGKPVRLVIQQCVCMYLCLSRCSLCSTTSVTKAVVCVLLSVRWCI